MPFVKINDQEIEVPAGITILEAARKLGIEIPHYCYHPGLKIVASCRMCLVQIQGMPKLVPSCSTTISQVAPERKVDGKYDMVVSTNNQVVRDAQESILEFLLLNHPVDCPECDQAGECLLQDYTFRYGKDHSRFDFQKRIPPRKDLGPNILLVSTRCILCSRCVRFTQEITGTHELFVKNRNYESEIDIFPNRILDNKLSMCTADICPVGALVTKDFLFKPRNWRYEKTRTICPGCSVGCNVSVEFMADDNKIYRIKPEFNEKVNQWWACDEGRLLYHKYARLSRLEYPMVVSNGEAVQTTWRLAYGEIQAQFSKFKADQIAVVGSGYATNEENYLLQKFCREALGSENVALNEKFERDEDVVYPRFTIKGEKIPNLTGARDMLQAKYSLKQILNRIQKGEIKALYYLGGELVPALAEEDLNTLKQLEFMVVQGIAHSPLAELAHVVLAGASPYEKEGTFTNYQEHVQRVRPSILPPAAAKPDFEILAELLELFGGTRYFRPRAVFEEISNTVKGYQHMSYQTLDDTGIRKGEGKPVEVPVQMVT